MATWYRKSPGGSTYEVFTNGSTTFSTAGRWYIKYVDDSGCETESTYDVTRCCACGDFSASKNSVSFASIGGSDTVTFSLTGSCSGSLTGLTPSTNDSWITPTFNSSHDTLTIYVSENVDTTTGRTGHTIVSYGNCDVVNIEVVQEKSTPGACTCNDFRVGSSPAAIPATGGSAVVTWEFTGSCTSVLVAPSVPSEATWCHVTTGNGVFNITVDNYPYSSGVTDRSATITPLLGESRVACTSRVFTVTQLAPTLVCTCNDFTLTGATNITSSSQSTAVIGTYTLPSCTGSITNYTSDVGWTSNLSCINGTVYGSVTKNTSTSPRSGTLSLEWTGGGLTCNKTTTFTQEGNACTCGILQGLGDKTIPSSGGTHVMGGISSTECASNVSFTFNPSTASTWITSTSIGSGDGDIKFTFSENTSTSERSCVVTPTIFGEPCSSNAFTVTQEGNSTKCYTITTTGDGSCEGGSIQFTATETPCPYVEIGGLKWATMNIGANSITDTGLYFQWGDISGYTASQCGSGEGKKAFYWEDYKYGNGTSSPGETGITKYNSTDGKTVLDLSDDAARINWGNGWRMPTTAEFQALGSAVNTAWTANYQGSGVAGMICTDKTDSSKVLFFPAVGYCDRRSVLEVGSYGYYWSSSRHVSDANVQFAYFLQFRDGNVRWQYYSYRYRGFPIRPVIG